MKTQQQFQRRQRTAKHVAEAFFWALLAGLASGTLAIMSRDADEPQHRVRVDCATGQLMDVLRDGSGIGPSCYNVQP